MRMASISPTRIILIIRTFDIQTVLFSEIFFRKSEIKGDNLSENRNSTWIFPSNYRFISEG